MLHKDVLKHKKNIIIRKKKKRPNKRYTANFPKMRASSKDLCVFEIGGGGVDGPT